MNVHGMTDRAMPSVGCCFSYACKQKSRWVPQSLAGAPAHGQREIDRFHCQLGARLGIAASGVSAILGVLQGIQYKRLYIKNKHWAPPTHQNATTLTACNVLETKYGCRYSILLELPYFDPTRMVVIAQFVSGHYEERTYEWPQLWSLSYSGGHR